jgi:hypothetical protein
MMMSVSATQVIISPPPPCLTSLKHNCPQQRPSDPLLAVLPLCVQAGADGNIQAWAIPIDDASQ